MRKLPEIITNSFFQKELLPLLKEDTQEVCILIFYRGYTVSQAYKHSQSNRTLRAMQLELKRKTKKKLTLLDLRLDYTLKNPEKIIKWWMKRGDYYPNRDKISPKLRFEILTRDNYQCVLCGRTAKESKLHIDHIIPLSKGGTNKIDNLRILCSKCNLGKGDKIFYNEQSNNLLKNKH